MSDVYITRNSKTNRKYYHEPSSKFSGYGINHKVKINNQLDLLASMNFSVKDKPHSEMYMVKGVNDHESSVYIDNGLHSYIGYLTSTIGQLVVVNLLLPLAEDNKLKKLVNQT